MGRRPIWESEPDRSPASAGRSLLRKIIGDPPIVVNRADWEAGGALNIQGFRGPIEPLVAKRVADARRNLESSNFIDSKSPDVTENNGGA